MQILWRENACKILIILDILINAPPDVADVKQSKAYHDNDDANDGFDFI